MSQLESVEQDFEIETFKSLTQKIFLSVPREILERDDFYVSVCAVYRTWNLGRRWLIQLAWDSKIKIHRNKKVREAHKPLGLLLKAIWNLCKECHASKSSVIEEIKEKNPYDDASVWFSEVFANLIALNIQRSHIGLLDIRIYNNNIKEARLNLDRSDLRDLRQSINPYDKDLKALRLLFDTAIALKNKSDVFVSDHWKPFIKAYSGWIAEKKKADWGANFVVEGKHYCQSGRGKKSSYAGNFIGRVDDYKRFFSETLTLQGLNQITEKFLATDFE